MISPAALVTAIHKVGHQIINKYYIQPFPVYPLNYETGLQNTYCNSGSSGILPLTNTHQSLSSFVSSEQPSLGNESENRNSTTSSLQMNPKRMSSFNDHQNFQRTRGFITPNESTLISRVQSYNSSESLPGACLDERKALLSTEQPKTLTIQKRSSKPPIPVRTASLRKPRKNTAMTFCLPLVVPTPHTQLQNNLQISAETNSPTQAQQPEERQERNSKISELEETIQSELKCLNKILSNLEKEP